ncbi:MAG: hypothetical protein F6K42_36125 [Leptolyngbya sp. SIO1D8]|nr:hypothetical protein [Leptolyngbya sp. SIO1D8]
MAIVVFSNLVAGSYQRQRTLTEGNISPVAFPKIALAVNRFIETVQNFV